MHCMLQPAKEGCLGWCIHIKVVIRGPLIVLGPGSHARHVSLALGQGARVQRKLLLAQQPQPLLFPELLCLRISHIRSPSVQDHYVCTSIHLGNRASPGFPA